MKRYRYFSFPQNMKYKKTFEYRFGRSDNYISKGFRFTIGWYGLQVLEKKMLFVKEMEAGRVVFKRKFRKRKNFRYFIRYYPNIARYKKSVGMRMGKGKGNLDRWYYPILPGQLMVEFWFLKRRILWLKHVYMFTTKVYSLKESCNGMLELYLPFGSNRWVWYLNMKYKKYWSVWLSCQIERKKKTLWEFIGNCKKGGVKRSGIFKTSFLQNKEEKESKEREKNLLLSWKRKRKIVYLHSGASELFHVTLMVVRFKSSILFNLNNIELLKFFSVMWVLEEGNKKRRWNVYYKKTKGKKSLKLMEWKEEKEEEKEKEEKRRKVWKSLKLYRRRGIFMVNLKKKFFYRRGKLFMLEKEKSFPFSLNYKHKKKKRRLKGIMKKKKKKTF